MSGTAPELLVDWCDHGAAKYAAQRWHYSGCLPAGRKVCAGVWEGGRFIGAVIFSRGASPYLGKQYGLRSSEVCELTRVALDRHVAPVTQIVSRALRLLRAHSPGLRLVVSFADPVEGHLGGIYQAGNWVFVGQSSPTELWWHRGKWRHTRSIAGRNGGVKNYREVLRKKVVPGKFKFLMPLDRRMRRKVEPLRLPPPRELPDPDAAARVAGAAPPASQGVRPDPAAPPTSSKEAAGG